MESARELLSVARFFGGPWRTILHPMEPAMQKLFAIDRLLDLYESVRHAPGGSMDAMERLLAELAITYHCDADGLAQIPRTGPVVVVANHPFGLVEGAVLATVLAKHRPDVRVLANSLLAAAPELRERLILVNPFGHSDAVSQNAGGLRECFAWLRSGGLLAAFPAGEVAHLDWKTGTLADPPWNPHIGRLARMAGATAVPVFFHGSNGMGFQLAGAVHQALRTASLPRELLNKRGRRIELRIGWPVAASTLQSLADGREAIEYLRCRTYLLDNPPETPRLSPARFMPPRKAAAVAAVTRDAEAAAEIDRLPARHKLCETGDFTVYLASEAEFPAVVQEIGRLREIAFRAAGEGTGRTIDLDEFDRYYLHLVLWHRGARQVAGGYRLGPTPDILPRRGVRGLYTNTLFRYGKRLFERLGPGIELGRSFIRPEYQKQFAPLLLLWKGIVRYVASRPECSQLFGCVSISRDYHAVSRHLMVRFLEAHREQNLAALVKPRSPYRPDVRVFRRTGALPRVPEAIEDLSGLIADLESDGKGVPILVKQYLKTGGRVLGLNVDRRFSDALDALILVDLRTAPQALLDRYLGKAGAAAFLASAAPPVPASTPTLANVRQ